MSDNPVSGSLQACKGAGRGNRLIEIPLKYNILLQF